MHLMSSKMGCRLQWCCLLEDYIPSRPLEVVRNIHHLIPRMEACKEASLIVVILAMVLAAILRVLQPTKRTSPCLFFPMKAVPCHCLFFAATFAMRMMSCHSCGNWICCLVRGGWIGVLPCWCPCLYLFSKDWAVRITSVGFGDLP